MFRSFRLQLTVWYLAFFGLLLIGFCGFLYLLLSRHLHQRLDASLSEEAGTAAALFQAELGEHHGDFIPAAQEALVELRLPATTLAFYAGGRLLAAARPEHFRNVSLPSQAAYRTIPDFGRHGARLLLMPFRAGSEDGHVAAFRPLDSVAAQLQELRQVFYLGLPLALLLAGAGGYLLAAKSLAPVVAMTDQAERISAESLERRLDLGRAKTEFGRLGSVLNQLLERLERSFTAMREFIADASHELRTPLAIICGESEVALSQDRPPAEYRESLAIIQDEARRLSRMVEDLLNLARADAGHQPIHEEEFYLNDLVDECVRAVQPLARQKQIRLASSPGLDLPFRGDLQLLRRMISNLLDNAIRYTPAGGRVSLHLETRDSLAKIEVSDTGIGIPAEDRERIFERFYRVDKARSRAEGGFGLGLSIVKWIVESHHGSVSVAGAPGQGSTFTVLLPLTQ
ncbi:MAG TPA: ATP-binding protein, partial [Bryobacteraceae bacterium]|nr:ATP-binding protein [Bryobacteraceae bacterium]